MEWKERRSGRAAAREILRAASRDLLDALFDRRCPGCGGSVARGEEVCEACDATVDRAGSVLCLSCLRGDPALHGTGSRSGCPRHGSERLLLAGPPHAPPLDAVIREFKYAGVSRLSRWVASLVPLPPEIDGALAREGIVVPVPLHPARRARRGYDQAELLADHLSDWWGVPLVRALRRVRETRPQARLGGEERRGNLAEAFRLESRASRLVAGRAVLLVDDVATTGSTLLEAAAALSGARPGWILALAAAHGGGPDEPQSPSQPEVATLPGAVLESRAWQRGRRSS